MTAGRKPKPTGLKLLEGNPGKRKLNRKEPKPRRVIPSPPATLSEAALVVWGRLTAVLDRMAVITEADAGALESLAETIVEVRDLRAQIAEHGRSYESQTEGGGTIWRPYPWVAQLSDAEKRKAGIEARFGLSPSDRSRIEVERDDSDSDPAEKYFGT